MLALIVAWFAGLRVAHEGYVVARIVTDPLAGDTLTVTPALRDAMVQALLSHGEVALPLAIAQVFLGGLLVVVSALALFRGRLSIGFGLQVLAANAGITVLSHWLGAPVRDAMVHALSASPELLGPEFEAVDHQTLLSAYEWAFHLGLAFQLLVLAMLAWALTRRAAREFLGYSPEPSKEG